MNEQNPAFTPEAEAYLARRRARLERLLQRPLAPRHAISELPPERGRHLREQAEELYWNELAWEAITAEEMEGGSELVEFAFPAFLAFIEGLLLEEVSPESPVPASPRPDVVEDVLRFLAARHVALRAATDDDAGFERLASQRLIDLVLYRLHGVDVEGVNRLESGLLEDED